MSKIKVGIDVGGTFTHAVAVDVEKFSILGKASVPTTHNSKQGVAEGVIASMQKLIQENKINPGQILLIAHSTTQATNALLEGDVAPVGIIAMGRGLEGRLAKRQAFLDDVFLAPGKKLPVFFRFINTTDILTEEKIEKAISALVNEGAQVFVATEVFGPDDNQHEKLVVKVAESIGLNATAACDLSQLYGIRVRTRTAVVNASMMPKMIETANLTEQAVKESGVKAPLMVMRSDGGIMDIKEMRKRPILTMLSGPAAGVAAALMYARISDGIFLEVGGTSTDISVIKNGMPQVKAAQIGKNRLSIKTIDVRTIGIGGGSIPRISGSKIVDVGPRSAHIANLSYSAYADNPDFSEIKVETICPKEGDPEDYLKVVRPDGNFTITPSAASYFKGLVKDFGHGKANLDAVKNAVSSVAKILNADPDQFAEDILLNCSKKIEKVIRSLAREYKLDKNFLTLYGGGGGASALVPHAAQYLKIKHEIAPDSEVISAIGAAMGMIRDTVEKSIINPSEQEIIAIRQAASESVIAMGAKPGTVEVQVEIDNANKKVVAIATGSSDLASRETSEQLDDGELKLVASEALKVEPKMVQIQGKTNLLRLAGYETVKSHFFGILKEKLNPAVVLTRDGIVKRRFDDVVWRKSNVSGVKTVISQLIEELRSYGDGGELMPDVFVVVSGKIIDLSGLIEISQILSLIEFDLKDLTPTDNAIVLAVKKR
ncbi:MAG: hydantoinase/oxoprolinase family protein [Bacteroides sp.]|jgi:N-methylhydantoinase A/oxoprolinase/acetone carboxylase beta subunit|nr:hydantoinase/oxoprolinase family protein [Bacteroides sp.]